MANILLAVPILNGVPVVDIDLLFEDRQSVSGYTVVGNVNRGSMVLLNLHCTEDLADIFSDDEENIYLEDLDSEDGKNRGNKNKNSVKNKLKEKGYSREKIDKISSDKNIKDIIKDILEITDKQYSEVIKKSREKK